MSKALPTRGRHLNHVARLYDPLVERLSFGREQRFRRQTLKHMQIRVTDQILDVGCGTGSLSLMVAQRLGRGGMVVGIDAAPEMIRIALRKAVEQDAWTCFTTGVAESLQFPDASFDWVVNSMFTHHLDTELKERAFSEMYRVLKPGGRMVTADIDRPSTIWGVLIGWGARFILLQPELIDNLRGDLPDLMRAAGFRHVRRAEQLYGLVSFFTAEKTG